MSPDPQYSMLSHYQFEFHGTCLQNYKPTKKSIYDICCISYKITNLQKSIHVRLNVALMEGESVPLCDF